MRKPASTKSFWRSLAVLASLATTLVGAAPAVAAEVVRARIDSIIHPVAAEYLVEALEDADRSGAELFVLELDTPGGLLTSTREMFRAMLGAETPVVVFVSPSGAQAASAGFFLLMAADIAAMAPGTNTGAAHPVSGTGEEIEGVMAEKIEEDSAATIRSLAEKSGRNVALAEAAVVESRSFTADEAFDEGLIDVLADSLPSLLEQLDGREVSGGEGQSTTLDLAEASVRDIDMSPVQKLLSVLAHPNIAYLLMSLGGLGLYFELSNPGAILPGVLGGICLILAFYGLSVLPVNYAGIALIGLALLFFIAEIKVTSYGLLTVGGVVSLVIGSLMLFKTVDPAVRVSLEVIAGVAGAALLLVVLLVTSAVRAHRDRVATGVEGLVGKRGTARSTLAPGGKVFVHGEIWHAVADTEVARGDTIEVVRVDGMNLTVRPVAETGTAAPGAATKEPS